MIIFIIADVVRNPGPPSLSSDAQKRLGSGRSDNRKGKTPIQNKPNGDCVRSDSKIGDPRHVNVKRNTPDRLQDESEVPSHQGFYSKYPLWEELWSEKAGSIKNLTHVTSAY